MNPSTLHDAGAPVIDAVRDASKSVGAMIPSTVHKLHVPHVPAHLPRRRHRRRSFRGLAVIGLLGLAIAVVAMKRRREPPPID